jgi:hypothetical protein
MSIERTAGTQGWIGMRIERGEQVSLGVKDSVFWPAIKADDNVTLLKGERACPSRGNQ